MQRLSVQALCARIGRSRCGSGLGTWLLVAFGAAVLSGQSSQPTQDQLPTRSPAPTDRDPQPAILDGDAYDEMLRAGVSVKPAFESEPYHLARALL